MSPAADDGTHPSASGTCGLCVPCLPLSLFQGSVNSADEPEYRVRKIGLSVGVNAVRKFALFPIPATA